LQIEFVEFVEIIRLWGEYFRNFCSSRHFWFEFPLDIFVSAMASTPCVIDQVSDILKGVFDRQMKEMEELHRQRVAELEAHIRHRDRRIEDLQELLTFRDAAVKSFLVSLRESHSAIDQVRHDKWILQKEKDQLLRRIDDLKQRPEPMPCGMPELTRAALDQVRKWDSDARVDGQKKEIGRLQAKVKLLKAGSMTMAEFWPRFEELNLVETMSGESMMPDYDPTENIFQFMRRLILEIQAEEDESEGEFAFSVLLPRVDPAFSAE
jgi:hypothetical protein